MKVCLWGAMLCMVAALLAAGCGPKPVEPRGPGLLPLKTAEGDNIHTAGPWRYVLQVRAKDTRSETRAGLLFKDGKPVAGTAPGERIQTPWGRMKWFGPPPEPLRVRPPYDFGWLHLQTYDQPVD
jgi:hypothetical protein